MLSRTAENLFWIGRYLERAETQARLLEVGSRNSLIPNISGGFRNDWGSILQASGTKELFEQKHGEATQKSVVAHMFFDDDNPSSVSSCMKAARENGRIVRTGLTSHVWDALNASAAELRDLRDQDRSKLTVSDLIDWTIRQTALVRGAVEGTQLRIDGYDFLLLGGWLERADATARLLDVKYFVLLPQVDYVGSGLDNYQWRTILRGLSAHRAFNWVYGGEITAAKIADFLILNRKSPRSLITCAEEVANHLDRLARGYGRTTEAQSEARQLVAQLSEITVSDIFDTGLHEFLTGCMRAVNDMSATIGRVYLSGDMR